MDINFEIIISGNKYGQILKAQTVNIHSHGQDKVHGS